MNGEKISGYIFLLIGVVLIAFGLYQSFNIFTAKVEPPEIFTFSNLEKVGIIEEQKSGDLQAQAEAMMQEQIKEIVPFDDLFASLPMLLNLISWSIFMGILVFAGAHVSGIGIKLIKT